MWSRAVWEFTDTSTAFSLLITDCLVGLFIDDENGGSRSSRNVGELLPDCTDLHPKKTTFFTPCCEKQKIKHDMWINFPLTVYLDSFIILNVQYLLVHA
jgi:hypothetical protein